MTNTSEGKKALETAFADLVAKHSVERLVACVVREAAPEAVFAVGFEGGGEVAGGGSAESPVPLDMQFRIASMTKCFAGAMTLLLRDEGVLSLHDAVTRYVPELLEHDRWSEVTVAHLLTMQSGLPTDDPWGDRLLGCSEAELDAVLSAPMVFAAQVGEEYHYSNLGYMILGRLLSRAAGRSVLRLIEERLLVPLGMESTSWNPLPGRAVRGTYEEDGRMKEEPIVRVQSDAATFGGLWSTARDLARWMDFLCSAFTPRGARYDVVLRDSSRRELQRAVISVPPRDSTVAVVESIDYAYGLRRFRRGNRTSHGHSGGLPGYGSHFRWEPASGLGVLALANLRYCPVWDPCREALHALGCEAAATCPPLVAQRAEELLVVANAWNDTLAEKLFASNVFLDVDRALFRKRLERLAGRLRGSDTMRIVPERGLGAKVFAGENPVLLFTLAPAEAGKVQEVKFFSES